MPYKIEKSGCQDSFLCQDSAALPASDLTLLLQKNFIFLPGATTFVHCCSDLHWCGCAWNNCAPTPLQQMHVQLHGGFSLIVTNQPQGRQHHCQGHYTTKKPWQEFFSSHIGQRGTGTPLADNIGGGERRKTPNY